MLHWHGFTSPFHYATYSKIYIHFQFLPYILETKIAYNLKYMKVRHTGIIIVCLVYQIVPLRRIGTLLDGSIVLLQSTTKLFSPLI